MTGASGATGVGRRRGVLELLAEVGQAPLALKAMTREQRDRFLATAYEDEPWWAPMWAVQVRTGLRPGETYALEEADLDLDAAQARIARTLSNDGTRVEESPKGNRARTIDLSAQT